jgi:hypothetical protein
LEDELPILDEELSIPDDEELPPMPDEELFIPDDEPPELLESSLEMLSATSPGATEAELSLPLEVLKI